MPRDLDLDLDSLWFTKRPVTFSPPLLSRVEQEPVKIAITQFQDGSRTIKKLTVAILWTGDLAITKFRLFWDPSDPRRSIRAEQKHSPAPGPPSRKELLEAQRRYGRRIVGWCQERIDTRVGDGECWTLAHDALQGVAKKCKSRGEEPVMVSQGRTHGFCLFTHLMPSLGTVAGGLELAEVAVGDILELKEAQFLRRRSVDSSGLVEKSWWNVQKHTAIITGVEGDIVRVLEQNVPTPGGKVREGRYCTTEMVKGEMRIYRPMGEGWVSFTFEW